MADLHLKELKRFSFDGRKCVLIVPDSAFYEVDELTDFLLTALEEGCAPDEAVSRAGEVYDLSEAAEAMEEIRQAGWLTSAEESQPPPATEPPPITTLCLNVAHACNMRCRYCFAGVDAAYGGPPLLMEVDIAHRAIDFLVEASGDMPYCYVIFFGGEPLLNFEVIRSTIQYARQKHQDGRKRFHFGMTTNGTLLTDQVVEYLHCENVEVMVSIDGPQKSHDLMRRFQDGSGTYQSVVAGLSRLAEKRPVKVRATFTCKTLNLVETVCSLLDLGVFGVELCPVEGDNEEYALTIHDMDQVRAEYEELAGMFVDSVLKGKAFSHLGLLRWLERVDQGTKGLLACGAGTTYVAVDPVGDIYLCHRFVGQENYKLGNLGEGIDPEKRRRFLEKAWVDHREDCRKCWARYLCGGICYHESIFRHNDLGKAYDLYCAFVKLGLETAMKIYLLLREEAPDRLEALRRRYWKTPDQCSPIPT